MTTTTPATTPADGELTLDASEVQFLAARLRRLFAHFKYKLPHWAHTDDKNMIGIAPTCIGAVLANLNHADEQRLAKGVLDDLASKGFCPPPQDETEAAERKHLGCAYCGTGIYADRATPSPGKAEAEDAARLAFLIEKSAQLIACPCEVGPPIMWAVCGEGIRALGWFADQRKAIDAAMARDKPVMRFAESRN